MTFASLGLSEPLLRALTEQGYERPTPVQLATIPVVLRGRDVWASAQTGSGKTAAFVLPILDLLAAPRPDGPRAVRALVLVPTRELAAQIAQVATSFQRRLAVRIKICVAVGGVSINPQMQALRGGADLVIATPGRLLELLGCNALHLGSLHTLVLDEADRMFSLGFAKELAGVLALLPSPCQKLLFSATFPDSMRVIAEALLREPERITVGSSATPSEAFLEQRAIEVDAANRTPLLRHLIEEQGWPSVLVFVASRHATEHVAQKLTRAGFVAAPLHGELTQSARTQALEDFKARLTRVLVATDVAARGLDIESLAAVVNYDLPRSPADYAHRIGRTGRAGESGVAVSFISADSAAHFRLIEKRQQLTLTREQIPGFEAKDEAAPPPANSGGVKGKRKSKKDKLREAAARR